MKNWQILLTILCTSLLLFLPQQSFAKKVHGTFRVVKGDVKVKSANGKVKRAKIGQKVYPKDTIIAAKDSRAKIVMIDKNIINISPNSEIVFEKYDYEPKKKKKNVLLNVIYGKVRSKVNQKYDGAKNKFRVKTPSAVAGVRGTDFFTSYNRTDNSSRVVTFEGEVKYGLPGGDGSIKNAVSVRAGQMASNRGGKAPTPPKNVPKAQLAGIDKSSDAEKAEPEDKRSPAEAEGNKPDKKEEQKKEAKKDNKQAKGKDRKRQPASMGPDTMLMDDDLAGTDGGDKYSDKDPLGEGHHDPNEYNRDSGEELIQGHVPRSEHISEQIERRIQDRVNTKLTIILNN